MVVALWPARRRRETYSVVEKSLRGNGGIIFLQIRARFEPFDATTVLANPSESALAAPESFLVSHRTKDRSK